MRRHVYLFIYIVAVIALMTACSTHKNTARNRFWHSFTAKYNTYYNGSQAFIDGNLEKEKGNKDNYTEMLPLYPVGNKQSRELGKGNYQRAIEKMEKAIKQHSIKGRPEWKKSRRKTDKDKEWLGRKEYNPFLWKAWLMLGRSQFQQGAFDEAAATFSYMSRLYQTQPAINSLARAWLAKCYTELNWLYDAEDVIRNMSRDSIPLAAVKHWDYTYANFYTRNGELEKAVPYLKKVIKHERRKTQKAREWFLLGQIETTLGHREEAYRAYSHVPRQNPPYELEFNARIAQTEVMAPGHASQMISRLKRMACNDNNKDYLDQVYYAIGNIYLTERDTARAIAAYEKGNEKATRSGIEKGVLLLKLGDLYWVKEKYNDAQRCYGEAIGLLDKDRPDYEELSARSKVLDELVPYTDAIYLQDSLQVLAKLPEKERLEAIDRVIEALKKKEKEERRKAQEEAVEKALEKQGAVGNRNARQPVKPTATQTAGGAWYFYNQMAVNQGKQQFQRQWGKRQNTDNWRRINQTVVSMTDGSLDEAMADSTMQSALSEALAAADSIAVNDTTATDSAQFDPHKREYYLAQIPFTEEQVAESNNIIKDGLFNSGVIFKDKLDNLRLSEKQLLRLVNNYADFEKLDEAYYHLFLLYSRQGKTNLANNCLTHLQADYPESEWTTLLSDPYFAENARFGEHIEDSLYQSTYHAFQQDRYDEARSNVRLSAERFPLGQNRPKFIFIDGLSLLNSGDGDGCLEQMKTVVEKYPQSEVSEMAGMIVKGVQEGRRLYGGKFDLGDVWSRRDITLAVTDSTVADTLSTERNIGFIFLLAYNPHEVNENQLLFELARYNFTNFLVRNFDIETDTQTLYTDSTETSLRRMMVSGFLNFDEALQYARQLYSDPSMAEQLRPCRSIIVSEPNLQLVGGSRFSYEDYQQFYEQTFSPMTISPERLLTIPENVEAPDIEDVLPSAGDEEDSQQQADPTDLDFGDDFF